MAASWWVGGHVEANHRSAKHGRAEASPGAFSNGKRSYLSACRVRCHARLTTTQAANEISQGVGAG
eukprot:6524853-Prymnesium_polylepis.1